MVNSDLNTSKLLLEYELDYEQLEQEYEVENLESILDFIDEDSIFPVVRHRVWQSILDNRYLVEDVVTKEPEGDYRVRHILHALIDTEEGTKVCSFLQRQPAGGEADSGGMSALLMLYYPTALLSYCHYCNKVLDMESVASVVGSAVGPQMTYWIDDAGERVCLQCCGGYLLGAVQMGGTMVMEFSAFMPEGRLALPRTLWPAEATPFADLIGRVISPKGSMQGKVLRADHDEVLEAILAFVRPMGVLKSRRVKRNWEDLWVWLLDFPQVWDYVAKPLGGKLFNANSIAHILSQMNEMGVVTLGVKSHIARLQPEANENFRTNLSSPPSDRVRGVVRGYLAKVTASRL